MRIAFISILLFLFTSCTFNKRFYQPERFNPNTLLINVYNPDKKDTLLIHLDGNDHVASFTDNENKPKDLAYTIETCNIKSTDGNTLYGWFLKPKNTHPKITILFLHGNGGNILSQFGLVVPFVKKGFQVFVLDYSGYGFSNGKPTRKNVLLDGNAALKMLHLRADVKDTKLLIYGQSIGGMIGTEVARENENIIDGLAIEGAATSHKAIGAHLIKHGKFLAKLLVHEKYCTVNSIRQFHKPVLIIHSTEDEIAPFGMGQKIYQVANSPKSFYEIKHGHIEGPLYYADIITYKITQMLNN